jgi:hypothetical protein
MPSLLVEPIASKFLIGWVSDSVEGIYFRTVGLSSGMGAWSKRLSTLHARTRAGAALEAIVRPKRNVLYFISYLVLFVVHFKLAVDVQLSVGFLVDAWANLVHRPVHCRKGNHDNHPNQHQSQAWRLHCWHLLCSVLKCESVDDLQISDQFPQN